MAQVQLQLQLLLLLLLDVPAVPSPSHQRHHPQAASVGTIWQQLSTWGPCSALDGCPWHSPISRASAEAAAPYIRRVSLFAATGGCFSGYPGCSADRDLFSDPRNASSSVDARPLLAAMVSLLQAGLHVRIVLGSVPIALSKVPSIGSFGFNVALPDSLPAYTAYIAEIARQIVAKFGPSEVAHAVRCEPFSAGQPRGFMSAT